MSQTAVKTGLYINPYKFIIFEILVHLFNTLRKGDADLRLYITTVQDG
jgi:hypothetical protein